MTYTELNTDASPDYFFHVINTIAKDKSKVHIVAANPTALITYGVQNSSDKAYQMPEKFIHALFKQPPNERQFKICSYNKRQIPCCRR